MIAKTMAFRSKKKPRFCMCRDYFGFGAASVLIGAFFLAIMPLVGTDPAKILVAAFFLILGVLDLVLYYFLREK